MPLPINIKDLIEQRTVESARIEYKSGWNPEPILHTICAFANDIENWGGGYIILGIEDENGMPRLPVKGLNKKEIDDINRDMLRKCSLIEPRYIPLAEQTEYDGKEIMVIWVPGGNDRPYKCPVYFSKEGEKKGAERAYYIRRMSNTVRANDNETRELYHISSNMPFDDRPNPNAVIEDMRHPLISGFLSEVDSALYKESAKMSVGNLAESMHIAGGPKENIRPLNVGLMFFNERPDNFFRYAYIEVVDKPDPTGDGMVEKIFTGPLDWQLRNALAFIRNYVIKEKIFKYPDRAESGRFFNYPFGAIEEMLTNAVYHRSYQVPAPITVVFTPDKMEITSFPGPDRSITDEDLKNCRLISKYVRNRRIGNMLKDLKMAEGRNTGIPRILRETENNGSERPIFETDAERRYFTVTLPVHRAFTDGTGHGEISDEVYKTLRSPKPYRSRSELGEEILNALKNEDLSRSGLARRLGYAKITDGMREAITELMNEGKIVHTIPDNPTNKDQKLRRV